MDFYQGRPCGRAMLLYYHEAAVGVAVDGGAPHSGALSGATELFHRVMTAVRSVQVTVPYAHPRSNRV